MIPNARAGVDTFVAEADPVRFRMDFIVEVAATVKLLHHDVQPRSISLGEVKADPILVENT